MVFPAVPEATFSLKVNSMLSDKPTVDAWSTALPPDVVNKPVLVVKSIEEPAVDSPVAALPDRSVNANAVLDPSCVTISYDLP